MGLGVGGFVNVGCNDTELDNGADALDGDAVRVLDASNDGERDCVTVGEALSETLDDDDGVRVTDSDKEVESLTNPLVLLREVE